MSKPKLWTREEVAQGILNGDALFVYDGLLVRATQRWLGEHPGGALAILHFVGRDATDEVNAYHSAQVLKRVKGCVIGRVEYDEKLGWEPLIPPVEQGWLRKDGQWYREADEARSVPTGARAAPSEIFLVEKSSASEAVAGPTLESLKPPPATLSLQEQTRLSKAYRELHKRVEDAGLYQTRYLGGYGPEVVRYIGAAILSYLAYQRGWYLISAVLTGFVWHQLTFFVHDLGHMGVTHNWTIDRLVGIPVSACAGGLSVGWWVDNHNIHHLVPNHPSHDPDIQHVPFFAISPVFLSNLYSSYYHRVMKIDAFAKFLLPFQDKLYYVVLSLARFNLYAQSYQFLLLRARRDWTWYAEIAGIAFYWNWFARAVAGVGGWKMRVLYLLVSHITASPVHVQIVLSHFSQSTDDLGPTESFPHRQLRTTSDVICSENVEFIHGGLHLQVTHHLFPRLPRHNLRAASLLVKEYCAEQGLKYSEFGFTEGNKEVLGVLREVAQQVKIVGMVAKAEVEYAKELAKDVKSRYAN